MVRFLPCGCSQAVVMEEHSASDESIVDLELQRKRLGSILLSFCNVLPRHFRYSESGSNQQVTPLAPITRVNFVQSLLVRVHFARTAGCDLQFAFKEVHVGRHLCQLSTERLAGEGWLPV